MKKAPRIFGESIRTGVLSYPKNGGDDKCLKDYS